jgi:hypothetical protein
MILQSKEIKYFDWSDIQSEICREMNIDEQYFRDYHEVIGGDYKDLWHEWMIYFDEVTRYAIIAYDIGESIKYKLEWIKADEKEWLEPFVKAVYKIWNDNKIEYIRY